MSLFLNLLFERDSYSNEYFVAKFGVDTAESGPLKVCQNWQQLSLRNRVRRFLGALRLERRADERGHRGRRAG